MGPFLEVLEQERSRAGLRPERNQSTRAKAASSGRLSLCIKGESEVVSYSNMNTYQLNSGNVSASEVERWLDHNQIRTSAWTPQTGTVRDLAEEIRAGKSKLEFQDGRLCRKARAVDILVYRWSGPDLVVLSTPRTESRPQLATLRACLGAGVRPTTGAQTMLSEAFPGLGFMAQRDLRQFFVDTGFWSTSRFPGLAWLVTEHRFCWEAPSVFAMQGISMVEADWLVSGLHWTRADPAHDRDILGHARARRERLARHLPTTSA